MKTFLPGILRHGPWDFDPEWFPGKEYSRDQPEEVPFPSRVEEQPTIRPNVLGDPQDFGESQTEEFAFINAKILRPPMKILQSAYTAIIRHLTRVPPEAGGMLLGPKGSPVVTHYVPDQHGRATAASFTLDAPSLNRILRKFLDCDMDAKGLVHSHPAGCTRPSMGDLAYVRRSFGNPKNTGMVEFLLPIVCGDQLYPYIIGGGDIKIGDGDIKISGGNIKVRVAELVLF